MNSKVCKCWKTVFFILLMLTGSAGMATAQSYSIGTLDLTLIDSSRGNRPVDVAIYYPADQSGAGVPVAQPATKRFPIVVFGHGFLIPWSSYQYIWDFLVPKGFIVVFPKTEGGVSPDHEAFARDMSFIRQEFARFNMTSGSLFMNRYNGRSAVMGHSMGGGAATLAASYDPSFTVMATLAAAETNPSAIAAAGGVNIPSLIISGGDDCVTPEPSNQIPMYNGLNSTCRAWVSITDASHCHFAQNNGTCTLGELFCNGLATPYQTTANLTNSFVISWLRYFLKFNLSALPKFESKLVQSGSQITYLYDCGIFDRNEVAKIEMPDGPEVSLFPNPAVTGSSVSLRLSNIEGSLLQLNITDMTGRLIYSNSNLTIQNQEETFELPLQNLEAGSYLITVCSNEQRITRPLLIY